MLKSTPVMTDFIPAGVNMTWGQIGTMVSALIMLTDECVRAIFQESYHCSIYNTSHQLYMVWARQTLRAGPWFEIKISSYQCRKSHCGDKRVIRSSYLHNGISYTGNMASLYWTNPWSQKHSYNQQVWTLTVLYANEWLLFPNFDTTNVCLLNAI